ncbi:MAG: hypothetical protein COY66_02820 [Candidatus Kerfeldbacteria bacterium CG_4_10_14_0_8_um_filter_42_10]|uniref:Carbohydrate kinase PfkB domain-containing protein n=1 Tax=Candidatus Kerfeldbacteria bacterium CG_4_10_14_0_8_um_filter_42_10 TaxID=2014248 RepID=A0A2M7RJA4_9BACT|nr:MAG: hypothetical protein COY66_02820 [Candidatus Kerfeldbacteria bacterium CG_4_10_14_0_8_um_filter_42_10]
MKNIEVLCLGSWKVDFFLKGDFSLAGIKDGEKNFVDSCEYFPGGSAANIAVGLSRLGIKTALYANDYRDELGDYLKTNLRREKVKYIASSVKKKTPLVVIINTKDKRFFFRQLTGQNDQFNPEKIAQYRPKYIVVSGNVDSKSIRKIFSKRIARLNVFLPSTYFCENKPKYFKDILSFTDIIQLNSLEAFHLLNHKGISEKNILRRLRELGPKKVILTKGKRGAEYFDGEKIIKVKSIRTDEIDETGAGDGFAAGFIYGLLKNHSTINSLKIGSFVASEVIKKTGAQTGLPTSKNLRILR